MTHIISLTVCTTLFSINCCTDGHGEAQMGRGQFFIGCSVPQSPTHLLCREKHLCTNLFVTIHWKDYLSSCHALVTAWCLKNMASQKFQAAWLAGRLGLPHKNHLTVETQWRRKARDVEEKRKTVRVEGVCAFNSLTINIWGEVKRGLYCDFQICGKSTHALILNNDYSKGLKLK